jgi:hypothetical protein
MVQVYIKGIQDAYGFTVTVSQQAKHQVLGPDEVMAEP